jgi:hypothetical protein
MGQVIFARIEKLLLQSLFARTYALLFSEQLSSTDHLQELFASVCRGLAQIVAQRGWPEAALME